MTTAADLRRLIEAVREARRPAMAGVTAPALDESAIPAYLGAVEALSEAMLSTPAIVDLVDAAERWRRGEIDDDEMRDIRDRLAAKGGE